MIDAFLKAKPEDLATLIVIMFKLQWAGQPLLSFLTLVISYLQTIAAFFVAAIKTA